MARVSYLAKVCDRSKWAYPFEHACEAEGTGTVYLSGQPSMDLETGAFIDAPFKEQFLQCMKNLDAALEASDCTRDDVIKVTVFLDDMKYFGELNEIYKEQFNAPYPARSCFAVKGLPLGTKVEIEMIAQRSAK